MRPETGTTPPPLVGSSLNVVRVLWMGVTLLVIALYALSASARFSQLLSVGEDLSGSMAQIRVTTRDFAAYLVAVDTLTFLAILAVAVIIFARKSDDWMALLVSFVLVTYALQAVRPSEALALAHPLVEYLTNAIRSANLAALLAFMFLFPNGQFVPRWSRILVAVWIMWMAGRALFPGSILNIDRWPVVIYLGILIATLLTGIIAQIYRYEEVSSEAQRRQTKWVVLGLGIALMGFITFQTPLAVVPSIIEPGMPRLLWIAIGVPVFYGFLFLLPLSIAASITRYRLWEIDFLINRSLVYGALTLGLGLVFLGSLFGLQAMFKLITGGHQSPIALAVSALVIGALFQPARRALRRLVDQRLYGINVNYSSPPPGSLIVWNQESAADLTGMSLGAYQVEEHLGRGGMADVYKGRHVTLHRPVAIKVLPAVYAKEPDFRRRFEREANMIARLRHPNIVQMYDFGEQDGTFYMVMEYISGGDLAAVIHEASPMPIPQVKRILIEMASALDYAHSEGIIHRDVKPSNIMLDEITASSIGLPGAPGGQRAVLTDFGIAKMVHGGTRITGSGLMGTFDYIAPEQIRDAGHVDGRTDVYALGIVTFQMLTGRLPFTAAHPGAVLIAHLQQPVPHPIKLRPDLGEDSAEALMRALAKDPVNRFPTAGEFAQAFC